MTKLNTIEARIKTSVGKHLKTEVAATDINSAAKIIQDCFRNNRIKAKVVSKPGAGGGMITANVTGDGMGYAVKFMLGIDNDLSIDFSNVIDQYQSALDDSTSVASEDVLSGVSLPVRGAERVAKQFQNAAIKELNKSRERADDVYEDWLSLLGVIVDISTLMGK